MFPQLRVHMHGVQREQMLEYKVAAGNYHRKLPRRWSKAVRVIKRGSTFIGLGGRSSNHAPSSAKVGPFPGSSSR